VDGNADYAMRRALGFRSFSRVSDADTLPQQSPNATFIKVRNCPIRAEYLVNEDDGGENLYGKVNMMPNGQLAVVASDGGPATFDGGAHAIVRLLGEPFLRMSFEPSEFGETTNHSRLFSEGDKVVFAGEILSDENGYLLKWSNCAPGFDVKDNAMGQAGLPYELLWIFCSVESDLYVTDGDAVRRLAEQGSLICTSNAGQLLSINAAAKFEVDPELYRACKDVAAQRIPRRLAKERVRDVDPEETGMSLGEIRDCIDKGRAERRKFLGSAGFARTSQL